MTAGINTKPPIGLLRFTPRPRDVEDIPIGTIVTTPTGARAKVIGYRGYRRDHRIRLVCKYLEPVNQRFDVVQLLPELVKVVGEGEVTKKEMATITAAAIQSFEDAH